MIPLWENQQYGKTEIGWKILCLGNWCIWKRVWPGFLKKLYIGKKISL